MSKTQRELLILGGILAALAVILVLRFSGGEEGTTASSPSSSAQQEQTSPSRPLTRGEMMRGEQGGARTAAEVQGELAGSLPLELVAPGLTDSAVTARIRQGAIPDPFSEVRGTVRRTTRSSQQQPARQQPRDYREVQLNDWPEGIDFQGLLPVMGQPGVYAAQFNNQTVRVGERIPGTDWELTESSRLLIRLRREDRSTMTRYTFQYIIPPLATDG